jgi:hypothetical protein
MNKFYDDNSVIENAAYYDALGTYDSPINISNITIGSAVVSTASAHGFSNSDQVKITKVVGLNSSTVDVDGIVSSSNFVNYHTFKVTSVAAQSFFLTDFQGNFLSTLGYSQYVSGGEVRKLVSTISGLTWLKGATVNYLADGRLEATTVVNSAGVITLADPAAVVQVGYNYNSDGKTLRPEAGSANGSAIGKLKRVYKAAFMLHQVGEFKIGPDFNHLTPATEIELFVANQSQTDQPLGLFSGVIRDAVQSRFDLDGQICFRQSSGLPGTIQSLTLMLEANDI